MTKDDFYNIVLPLQDRMYRIAKTILCDRDEARDAVQDTLEIFWNKKDALGGYSKPETFIIVSLRNRCIDMIRSRKGKIDGDESVGMTQRSICSTPESTTESRDLAQLASTVIEKLPYTERLVMTLRDVEGYEFEEISRVMEIEPTAVRMAVSRARKKVREEMMKIMNYGIR